MTLVVQRAEIPRAPTEFQDDVELWARQSGRHAKLVFVPTEWKEGSIAAGTWVVRIQLRSADPRLEMFQQGRVPEAPTEDVWIHEPAQGNTYKPLNIQQMGTSGLRRFLEKGNMWSGRGEFNSLEDQLRRTRADNEQSKRKFRRERRDSSVYRESQKRRWRLKIPFISVAINLRKDK